MERKVKREIYRYVRTPFYFIVIGVFCLGLSVFMWYSIANVVTGAAWLVTFGGCGLWWIISTVVKRIALRRRIAQLAESADGRILENDFKRAGRAFKGTLILGDKFIIPKGSGNIVAYDEFDKLHRVTESINGVTTYHTVFVRRRSNGRKLTLCKIEHKIYDASEMGGVLEYIISKNPELKFGEI